MAGGGVGSDWAHVTIVVVVVNIIVVIIVIVIIIVINFGISVIGVVAVANASEGMPDRLYRRRGCRRRQRPSWRQSSRRATMISSTSSSPPRFAFAQKHKFNRNHIAILPLFG